MLTETIKSEYIYEIDLKGCFPSISLPRLRKRMTDVFSVPPYMANFYIALNYVLPQVKGVMKEVDNKLIVEQQSLWLNKANNLMNPEVYFFGVPRVSILSKNQAETFQYGRTFRDTDITIDPNDSRIEQMTGLPGYLLESFICSLDGADPYERKLLKSEITRSLSTRYDTGNPFGVKSAQTRLNPVGVHEYLKHVGTIQGSPISPFLADMALTEIESILPKGVKILQYADDAILYGDKNLLTFINNDELNKGLTKIGLCLNKPKSGWVKQETWNKELKFLGTQYNGETDQLTASTRKGATLPFTKRWLLHTEYDILYLLKTDLFQIQFQKYQYLGMKKHWLNQIQELHSQINAGLTINWKRYAEITKKYHLSSILAGFQFTLEKIKRYLEVGKGLVNKTNQRFIYDLLPLISLFFLKPIEWTTHLIYMYTKFPNKPMIVEDIVKSFYDEKGNLKSENQPNEFNSLFDLNKGNPYINKYRDKYTWNNFLTSQLSGMLLSRLYNNQWNLDNLEQDFTFKYHPKSLAARLHTENKKLTIFTGSSYAFKSCLNILMRQQKDYNSVKQNKALESGLPPNKR
jgi:hypothetical protein